MHSARARGEREQRLLVDRAGDGERDQLAVAVTRGHLRPDADPLEEPRHREIGDAERRLRDPRVGDRGLLRDALLRGEGGAGEEAVGDPAAAASERSSGNATNRSASIRGRWLPWPGKRNATSPVVARRRRGRPRGSSRTVRRESTHEAGPRLVGHDGVDRLRARVRRRRGEREVAQRRRPVGGEHRVELREAAQRRVARLAPHDEQLRRPLVAGRDAGGRGPVRGEHGVEVGPAEAEGAHPGDARLLAHGAAPSRQDERARVARRTRGSAPSRSASAAARRGAPRARP